MKGAVLPERVASQKVLFFVAALMAGLVVPVSAAMGAKDHACEYIKKEEVATVLATGVSEAKPQASNPMGQNICVFDIPGSKGLGLVQLQMLRTKWAKQAGMSGLTAPSLFENSMSYLENAMEIEGLGDMAYWGGTGLKMGAGLHVLYKDTFMTITVEVGDAEVSLVKARELATLVLDQLK